MFTSVLLSVVLTFMFVFAVAYGASTISTNISTGGTLTVTGTADITGITTVTGLANLNGGIAVDTTNFTVSGTTGDVVVTTGTLTVGGNSILASTDIGGGYTAGSGGSGLTLSAAGKLQMNNNLEINGMATTTGSTGNFQTRGAISASSTLQVTGAIFSYSNIGAGGTSTPSMEISAYSESATSTLYLHSNTSGKGGCIQMNAPDGSILRMYATTTGIARWETGGCKDLK